MIDDLDTEQLERQSPSAPLTPDLSKHVVVKTIKRTVNAVEKRKTDLASSADRNPIKEYSLFYKESVPRLISFLRWQGAPLAEAADCVQEALMQALPPKWETINNPHSWCRVAAFRIYRRRLSNCKEIPTAEVEFAGYPLITPETNTEAIEKHHQVLRLIDQLSPRQRQVIAWTYDGASSVEVAEGLGIKISTVRSTLRAARAALNRMIEEEGGAM
jgi:RNA polymerase sigma-70 factor (ECF subfamily)